MGGLSQKSSISWYKLTLREMQKKKVFKPHGKSLACLFRVWCYYTALIPASQLLSMSPPQFFAHGHHHHHHHLFDIHMVHIV